MINVTAKQFKLTKAIENKVIDELQKINKFELRNKKMNVSLSTETYGQKAEISLTIDKGQFHAENISSDLYSAIEDAVRTLIKQIRRYLDSKKSNERTSIRFEVPKDKTIDEENSNEPKIVKHKMITAKPMFELEAVLQMELLDHHSFMFHNADTDSPCMIYKKKDGNYGMIEII